MKEFHEVLKGPIYFSLMFSGNITMEEYQWLQELMSRQLSLKKDDVFVSDLNLHSELQDTTNEAWIISIRVKYRGLLNVQTWDGLKSRLSIYNNIHTAVIDCSNKETT